MRYADWKHGHLSPRVRTGSAAGGQLLNPMAPSACSRVHSTLKSLCPFPNLLSPIGEFQPIVKKTLWPHLLLSPICGLPLFAGETLPPHLCPLTTAIAVAAAMAAEAGTWEQPLASTLPASSYSVLVPAGPTMATRVSCATRQQGQAKHLVNNILQGSLGTLKGTLG